MGQTLSRFPAPPLLPRAAPAGGEWDVAIADAPLPATSRTKPPEVDDLPSYRPATGYGHKRLSGKALLAALLIHAAAALGLLQMGISASRETPPERLAVFDVAQKQPPPPAPPPPQQPQLVTPAIPPSAQVTAPTPMLAVVQQRRVAPAIIDPQPAPVVAVEAPAAPAKQPAAAASVTPPDFSAAQLNNPGPEYPFQSRRDREQGVVLLRVLVTPEGRAGEVRLERSSGYSRLDRAALKTVRQWRFVPAKQAGAAVAAWVLVPVRFSLS